MGQVRPAVLYGNRLAGGVPSAVFTEAGDAAVDEPQGSSSVFMGFAFW